MRKIPNAVFCGALYEKITQHSFLQGLLLYEKITQHSFLRGALYEKITQRSFLRGLSL